VPSPSGALTFRPVLSVGIVALIAMGVYYFLTRLLELEAAIATPLTGLVLGTQPQIDQALKQGTLKLRRPTWPDDAVPLREFAINWRLMLLYTAFLTAGPFALFELLVLFMPVMWMANFTAIAPWIAVPSILFSVYFVGRWVGARCDEHGLLVATTGPILGALLFISYSTISMIVLTRSVAVLSTEAFLTILIIFPVVGTLGVPPCLLGYWRGRRKRMTLYLRYLLTFLSPDEQRAILDMAYEAARDTHKRRSDEFPSSP
jgi:hypothetical protein